MISLSTLLRSLAIVVVPCIIFVELFLLLPFSSVLNNLYKDSTKSLAILRAKTISDHWKEKVMPHYAGLIFKSTCFLGFFLVVVFSIFVLSFLLICYLLQNNFEQSISLLLSLNTQIAALAVGCLYAAGRAKFSSSKHEKSNDYSATSALFHRIALNFGFIRELTFDIDCALTKQTTRQASPPPPVFVAGLARGGTTILLEALYSSGEFTTLTYRNMPFVLAPNFWPKLSKHFHTSSEKKERAHGDRLEVGFDSPEAFEEVFWLTFSEDNYIGKTALHFQSPNKELAEKFRRYVENIITASSEEGENKRYLAKNNNNILRIELIKEAFPDSIILVPFRNPLDHARSLLKQHVRFCETHEETPFTQQYMDWLGHHEFGNNIKLFKVADRFDAPMTDKATSITLWLDYWTCLYDKILSEAAEQVVFFDYDQLCRSPKTQLTKLSKLLSLKPDTLFSFANSILPANIYKEASEVDPKILSEAEYIHQKLVLLSL